MKNILITGGAGFIGSNITRKLVLKNYNVTILDCLSEQIHGNNPSKTSPLYQALIELDNITFIKGSVISKSDWLKAIKGQDAIIHLAAETGTGQSMYEIQRYIDTNIGGTGIMLDIMANEPHSIKKMIVASSRSIYGEGKYNCKKCGIVYPIDRTEEDMSNGKFECTCPICGGDIELLATSEDSKIQPSSIYGITKQTQEEMVLVTGKSLGIPAVAFRYQNVYGPGQSLSNPYTGILSIFSTQIKNGNNINIFEDGLESRDFVYIDDIADATILGLEKDEANYNVYNVGADKPVDVITVAKTLRSNYNSNIDINITGNFRLGDIRHNYADLSKIQKDLGFTPKYNFDKGIANFCKWVNKQDVMEDKYSESIKEMKKKGLYKC